MMDNLVFQWTSDPISVILIALICISVIAVFLITVIGIHRVEKKSEKENASRKRERKSSIKRARNSDRKKAHNNYLISIIARNYYSTFGQEKEAWPEDARCHYDKMIRKWEP